MKTRTVLKIVLVCRADENASQNPRGLVDRRRPPRGAARLAGCGGAGSHAGGERQAERGRRRELLGQHRRTARRRPGRRHRASSPTPPPTRTTTNRPATTPARWRARRSRSSTGSATTNGPRSCSPPTPAPARVELDGRRRARPEGRRQPSPVVLADLGAQGDRRRSSPTTSRPIPATTPTSTAQARPLRDRRAWRATTS